MLLRTTPGDAQGIDIVFLDERGADLSQAAQRRVERVFSRQEFRRAFPGEIADLTFPARFIDTYAHELLAAVDTTGIAEAGLRVVVDAAGGAGASVLPVLLGQLGVDVLTVNGRLDESMPTETIVEHMRGMERLADLVASSRAAFGIRFDPVAERLSLVDERGELVPDDRALLVLMDLVAAERHRGDVALPITTTRIAERVAGFHGCGVRWTSTSPDDLSRAALDRSVLFAGDGRGGFIVPEFSTHLDALAAFVRLLGLVARTHLRLSEIDARIPVANVARRTVPTPWAAKGTVMRMVVEAAGDRPLDTTDGVRITEADGGWTLVLPDPSEAVTHLWAEAGDAGPGHRARRQLGAGGDRRPQLTPAKPVRHDNGDMTRPPRSDAPPRPDASMSLLNDVITTSLDPAYAEAAARRQDQPPQRRHRWPAVAMLLAVGLALGLAVHQSRERAPAVARARAALVETVQNRTASTADLQRQVERLRERTAGERSRLLDQTTLGSALNDQVNALERETGTTPLSGPGLQVRLDDAHPQETDPLGGTGGSGGTGGNGAPPPAPERVLDRDVQEVVNALWAAGAKGVAVNGVRITAVTAIRSAGAAILVDFRPLSPPYEISAVGDPEQLETSFGASATADRFRTYHDAYGLGFDYSRQQRLTLPAAAELSLRYASPAPRSTP